MKAKHYREGKLVATEISDQGRSEVDPDALGTIADLQDFLEKTRRLRAEVTAPEGSVRHGVIRQIEHCVDQVEQFRRGHRSSHEADHALLHMLHAAAQYTRLLAEIADDARHDSRGEITRASYLEARAKYKTQEAIAAALGVSVQGLRKWRRINLGN
jgi:hypothetical protein